MTSGSLSWRRYLACVAVLGPLVELWSIATPLGAAYDEHQHLWRAAAIVRGQFLPPDVSTRSGTESILRIPGGLVTAIAPECTAFHRNRPASCASGSKSLRRTEIVTDTAGRYPPVYYLLIGWPTLVLHGDAAVWAVRAVSAALVVALLALALALLLTRSRAGPLGFAIALTPMCLFLGGVVNPSGVEIAAAMATWAAVLCLADDATPPPRQLLWVFAAAGAALAVTRPLGPLMLGIIVVFGGLIAGRDTIRRVRDTRNRGPLALLVTAGISQLAWLAIAGAPHLTTSGHTSVFHPWPTIVNVLTRQTEQVRLMIGRFGWGETPAPLFTYVAWAVAAALLAVVALRGRRRTLGVALVIALAIVALQLTFDLIYLDTLGPFWGARYSMPLAVGIPLVVMYGMRPSPGKALARLVLPLVALGHFAALARVLHRFAVGFRQPLFAHPVWQPPGGVWLVVALFAVAVAGYALFLVAGRMSSAEIPASPAVPAHSDGT